MIFCLVYFAMTHLSVLCVEMSGVHVHVQSPIALSYCDAVFVDHVQPLEYHGYWGTGWKGSDGFFTDTANVNENVEGNVDLMRDAVETLNFTENTVLLRGNIRNSAHLERNSIEKTILEEIQAETTASRRNEAIFDGNKTIFDGNRTIFNKKFAKPGENPRETLNSSKSIVKTENSSEFMTETVTSIGNTADTIASSKRPPLSLQNTGQSAIVRVECQQHKQKPFISHGLLPWQNRYIFEQLHFHWANCDEWGSEHMVERQKYSMEAHFVHYNANYRDFDEAINHADGLVVVAFFIQASGQQDCSYFSKITDNLRDVIEPMAKCSLDADCLQWLNQQELNKHYFMYHGSLTTPPFIECVTWIIYPTPIYVSHRQVAAFRALRACPIDRSRTISQNYRPLQIPPVEMPRVLFARSVFKSKL